MSVRHKTGFVTSFLQTQTRTNVGTPPDTAPASLADLTMQAFLRHRISPSPDSGKAPTREAASVPPPHHAQDKSFLSQTLPHAAPETDPHATPPSERPKSKSLSSVPAKQLTPLAILRLRKRAAQNQRIVEARASMKQRLHCFDYAATGSIEKLSGREQAAWWCGSSRSLDLSGLSEEHADASREYALLSEGVFGEFA